MLVVSIYICKAKGVEIIHEYKIPGLIGGESTIDRTATKLGKAYVKVMKRVLVCATYAKERGLSRERMISGVEVKAAAA